MPADEAARLQALDEYQILDTVPEPAFDDLTQLAAHLCDTPTALLTLVDATRQWFKSRVGLDLPETHRDLSFCAHVVGTGDEMVVHDARQDARFVGNDLVTGAPYIRFYAGVPLATAEGHVLGTVAVIDIVPRTLTGAQLAGLRALARQAIAQFELRRRVLLERQDAASARLSEARTSVRHLAVLDSMLDAVVSIDHGGHITEFNPAASAMFGYAPAEALGRVLADLMVPADLLGPHSAALHARVSSGTPMPARRFEVRARRRDGSEFPVEVSVQQIPQVQPPAFTGVIRDLSERQALEARLRESQKMEAMGRLAGGVAHDFNNLLTIIRGHAALLRPVAAPLDGPGESLQQIDEAVQRAASLTQQLLALGRRQILHRSVLDLNSRVSGMVGMLQRVIGERIVIRTQLTDASPLVTADPGMLDQVLLNLVVNARDAMPQGGEVIVGTSVRDVLSGTAGMPDDVAPGAYACLTVRDTGCGISPEALPRIFEPFYTTKGLGGSGLGLSTAYGIVTQHHGWIDASSKVGQGTTFEVLLPVATEANQVPETVVLPQSDAWRGTVLLVEDEPALRQLASLMLRQHGFQVFGAADAVAALRVWEAEGSRTELLITDMVMPGGMSGLELAERVRATRGDVPVVIMSGYSAELSDREWRQRDMVFLQKPFSPAQLMSAIQDARVALRLAAHRHTE